MMEFYGGFSDLMKEVLFQTTHFVTNNRLYSVVNYVNDQLWLGYCDFCVIHRIFVAILFRLLFGTWLKAFKVVPFQVFEKNDYYEDPGVLEMHALLRGEDCFDTSLDQQQQLPFPPADYDPYDKIYLAVYFFRLQRKFKNLQASWIQHNSIVCRRLCNSSLFQYFSRYLSSRVAVNIHE